MDTDVERGRKAIRDVMQLAAVRALIASHPQPEVFRAAWAGEMAHLWRDSAKIFGGLNPESDYLRELQAAWESLIPESRGG